jgi:hypothetical protein
VSVQALIRFHSTSKVSYQNILDHLQSQNLSRDMSDGLGTSCQFDVVNPFEFLHVYRRFKILEESFVTTFNHVFCALLPDVITCSVLCYQMRSRVLCFVARCDHVFHSMLPDVITCSVFCCQLRSCVLCFVTRCDHVLCSLLPDAITCCFVTKCDHLFCALLPGSIMCSVPTVHTFMSMPVLACIRISA